MAGWGSNNRTDESNKNSWGSRKDNSGWGNQSRDEDEEDSTHQRRKHDDRREISNPKLRKLSRELGNNDKPMIRRKIASQRKTSVFQNNIRSHTRSFYIFLRCRGHSCLSALLWGRCWGYLRRL